MPPRSKTMKIDSGNVICRKFTANSGVTCEVIISGTRTVTNMIIMIIMLKAIIKYFNLNVNTPDKIIKERNCYVNLKKGRD
jgi:hypothetical protein